MEIIRRGAPFLFIGCLLAFAGGAMLVWIDAAPAWYYLLGAVLTMGTLAQTLGPWASSRRSTDYVERRSPITARVDRAMLHLALLRFPQNERTRWQEELQSEIRFMADLDPVQRRLIFLSLLLPHRQSALKLASLLVAVVGIGVPLALTLGVAPAAGIIGGLLSGGLIDRLWLADRLTKEAKVDKRRGT